MLSVNKGNLPIVATCLLVVEWAIVILVRKETSHFLMKCWCVNLIRTVALDDNAMVLTIILDNFISQTLNYLKGLEVEVHVSSHRHPSKK